MLGTNIHNDLGFVEVIAKEREDVSTLTEGQETDYMEQGQDR